MKTSDLLMIGALGVGAYLLFSKGAIATTEAQASTGGGTPQTFTASAVTPQGVTVRKKIDSVVEGVNFMNDTSKNNATLQRTSETIAPVNFTVKSTGQSYSGNIARLATGKEVAIAIAQPVRDSSGMTAIDRIIAKNKAASGTK